MVLFGKNEVWLMIYAGVFLLTGLLIHQSEYYEKKHRLVLCNILSVSAILFISIFAGIRDVSVGTDVGYYVTKHYKWGALFSGQPWKYIVYLDVIDEVEPLYSLIQYIGYHVFHSIHFVLFSLSLITHVFIYLGLKEKKEQIHIATAWCIYCFLFFNTSLNIVRQSCAVAMIFYVVMAFSNGGLSVKRCILLIVLAMGFHRSVLFVVGILFVLIQLLKEERKGINYILAICVCMFPFAFGFLFPLIANFSFLPLKYQVYFNKLYLGQSTLLMDAIIYSLPTLILIYLVYVQKNKGNRKMQLYLSIALISIFCSLASNLMINRVSYYFTVFFCYSVSYTARLISPKAHGRTIYCIVMIGWFSVMWYINTISYGYGDTYPYILGI